MYGIGIFFLQELHTPEIIQDDAVPGILLQHEVQLLACAIVIAVAAEDARIEVMGPRKIRLKLNCLLQDGACTIHVTFLHGGTTDVHPTVGIFGIRFCDLLEGRFCAFEIALQ